MKRVGQIFREGLAKQIKDGVENNSSVFVLNYAGLSSLELNGLRKNLRNAGAKMYVAKNRVVEHVFKDIQQEGLIEKVGNQTAIIWGSTDSVEISKVLVNFTKDREKANVTGGLLEGRLLEAADVKKLSDLPSREVLLATLLGTIQAPVTRLLGAMNAKSRDLLSILKQLSEKKEDK